MKSFGGICQKKKDNNDITNGEVTVEFHIGQSHRSVPISIPLVGLNSRSVARITIIEMISPKDSGDSN